MIGNPNPKNCCDPECAMANYCEMGGITCNRCGCFFCASEIDEDGYCDECAKIIEEEEEDEEEELVFLH